MSFTDRLVCCKVALGSDVAGGYSPSMLDAIRQSIIASNCCSMDHRDGKRKPRLGLPTSTSTPSLNVSSLPSNNYMQNTPLSSSWVSHTGSGWRGPGIKRSISFDTRSKLRSQSEVSLSALSLNEDECVNDDQGVTSVAQGEWDQFALDMSNHGDVTPIKTGSWYSSES